MIWKATGAGRSRTEVINFVNILLVAIKRVNFEKSGQQQSRDTIWEAIAVIQARNGGDWEEVDGIGMGKRDS